MKQNRWITRKDKLEKQDYWFGNAHFSAPDGPEDEAIASLFGPGQREFGKDIGILSVGADRAQDPEALRRIAAACKKHNLFFWLWLAYSVWQTPPLNPEAVKAINDDPDLSSHFLGLLMWEIHTPSLTHGAEFPDVYPWLIPTHLLISESLIPWAGESQKHVSYMEQKPEVRSEPLPKPIENPVEFLRFWREAFRRNLKRYLGILKPDQAMTFVNWVGSVYQRFSGFYGLKQAMGLYPFENCQIICEVNNFDRPEAYAEARGISRTSGFPWGVVVGGVIWKYWQFTLHQRNRPHIPLDEARDYGATLLMPGWYIFIPAVIAWAGGARIFLHESSDKQLVENPQVRAAVGSLHSFLSKVGPPMDPEVRTAFIKGDAYFAADLPGYENGMEDELNTAARYCLGMDCGPAEYHFLPIHTAFYPRIIHNRDWHELLFSGNPNGEVDFLPSHAPLEILKNYERLIMIDWHCMRDESHQRLLEYVKSGGQLLIAAGQLFSQEEDPIDWRNPSPQAFYRSGDLLELCGLRLAGGSKSLLRTGLKILENSGNLFFPTRAHEAEDVLLYEVAEIAPEAEVVVATEDEKPVCLYHSLGQGGVYTVLGPSYHSALKEFLFPFFNQLAEANRRRLSYEIKKLNFEEEKDLVVYRDFQKPRIALCNYCSRYDLTPEVTLKDLPSGSRRERIVVASEEGEVAHLEGLPCHRPSLSTCLTVPSNSIALAEFLQDEASEFSLTYRIMPTYLIWAIWEPQAKMVASTSQRFGPARVTLQRSPGHVGFNFQETPRAEVGCSAKIQLQDFPPGLWKFHLKVENATGVIVKEESFQESVGEPGTLEISPDRFGALVGGWRIHLHASKI